MAFLVLSRNTWVAVPKEVQCCLIGDLVLVRLKGVLTAAKKILFRPWLQKEGAIFLRT